MQIIKDDEKRLGAPEKNIDQVRMKPKFYKTIFTITIDSDERDYNIF